jgi:large subunit ribosomal protein L19
MSLQTTVCNTIINIGDTVTIGQKIQEGEKERIQNFTGIVIAMKGNQGEKTFTVRRIAAGAIGVEKIFPVDMPSLVSVKVIKQSSIRRSKLYYLRERGGKAAMQLPDKKIKQKQEAPVKKVKEVVEKNENTKEPVKRIGKSGGKGSRKVSSKK